MRRTGLMVLMVILCAALATPLMASADGQTVPPEANGTPTPPARAPVDVHQLTRVLVDKGVITPGEYRQLTQPQASAPAPPGGARVWTWDEVDHPPVRSTGGD